ncbi:MAG: SDR family oxidoreductase [Gemmatimonadales bacterium]
MTPEADDVKTEDLRVGLTETFLHEVSDASVASFARVTGDHNPLHTNREYAVTTNFGARIVHGAYQVGLASRMVGMHLPGRRALVTGMNARFVAPLKYPSQVRVTGEITAWNAAEGGGQVKVVVQDANTATPTAEVFVAFSLHEREPERVIPRLGLPLVESSSGLQTVMITGASGGLGAAIARQLASDYLVLAVTNRRGLAPDLEKHPRVVCQQADITTSSGIGTLSDVLGDSMLYAVVHAAWPGMPKGGLLDAPTNIIERQLAFGTSQTISLARLLFRRAPPNGARFVGLGSVAGTMKPVVTLATYGLAKAALEQTVRLLAPELARRNVTINAVCPSYVATGIHADSGERQRKLEVARVPLGRLCTSNDVASLVHYLLSAEASFISGQIIGLTGGQL